MKTEGKSVDMKKMPRAWCESTTGEKAKKEGDPPRRGAMIEGLKKIRG